MTDPTLAGLQDDINNVDNDLQDLKTRVPTLEELFFSLVIDSWKGAADQPICLIPWSFRSTLIVAPINLTVLSVAVSFDYWSQPASDTAYWQAALEVGIGATGFVAAATRSTQATGANANGAVTARTVWTFDAATGPAPISVQQGQLFTLTWTPVGNPAAMKLPMTVTIRAAAA